MSRIRKIKSGIARIARATLPVAGSFAAKLKSSVSRRAMQAAADGVPDDAAVSFDPEPMATIHGERAKLDAQIDVGARRGYVSDALALCYFASLIAERDEHKRRLTECRRRLEASLRRLSARCPEPVAPEPAPPSPERRRSYRSISDWLPGEASGRPH